MTFLLDNDCAEVEGLESDAAHANAMVKDLREPSLIKHERLMKRGSTLLRKSVHAARSGAASVPAPGKLIWLERVSVSQQDPHSENTRYRNSRLAVIDARRELAEANRIASRDPCPNCGTRGDIGCKHQARGW